MVAETKVSIRAVSRLSGVSVSTVSRIINQTGRFSKETEARVFQVMRELNYIPNQLAQSMRASHNQAVGIIIPDVLNEKMALIVRIIQYDMQQAGYVTSIFNIGESNDALQRCLDMMRAQRMAGMICVPHRSMQNIPSMPFPVVYIGRRPENATHDSGTALVACNDFEAGYLAGKRLVHCGCERIGVLMDIVDLTSHKERLKGIQRTLEENGLTLDAEHCIIRANSQKTTETIKLIQTIINDSTFPDGIFAMEARSSIGLLKCIYDHRPDLKMVGFDHLRITDYGFFDYDCIVEPVQKMATAAAKLLLDMIQYSTDKSIDRVYQPHLHISKISCLDSMRQ